MNVINNLGTPSFEQQINFGVLQIDLENSAAGEISTLKEQLPKVLLINIINHVVMSVVTKHTYEYTSNKIFYIANKVKYEQNKSKTPFFSKNESMWGRQI